MLEVKSGVFVGRLPAGVRDRLWDIVCDRLRRQGGGAVLAYSTNNEQGFALRSFGDTSRELVDFDGLTLVRVKIKKKTKKGTPAAGPGQEAPAADDDVTF